MKATNLIFCWRPCYRNCPSRLTYGFFLKWSYCTIKVKQSPLCGRERHWRGESKISESFFDKEFQLEEFGRCGDPLTKLNELISWEVKHELAIPLSQRQVA